MTSEAVSTASRLLLLCILVAYSICSTSVVSIVFRTTDNMGPLLPIISAFDTIWEDIVYNPLDSGLHFFQLPDSLSYSYKTSLVFFRYSYLSKTSEQAKTPLLHQKKSPFLKLIVPLAFPLPQAKL